MIDRVLTLLWIEAPKDMTSPQVSGLKPRSALRVQPQTRSYNWIKDTGPLVQCSEDRPERRATPGPSTQWLDQLHC